MEDFIPPHVPDDQNVAAAPIFREYVASKENSRVRKLVTTLNSIHHQPYSSRLADGDHRLIQIAKNIDPMFSGDEAAAGRIVLEALNPAAPVLEEAREALRRPKVEWPVNHFSAPCISDYEYITPCWEVAKMLRDRALAELSVNFSDKAAQDTLTILAMAEAVVPPRQVICELVRESILRVASEVISDGLRRRAWTDSNLSALSQSLPQQNLTSQMADSLRMERASVLQWMLIGFPRVVFDQPNNRVRQGERLDEVFQRLITLYFQLRPMGWDHRDRARYIFVTQQLIESLSAGKRISPNEVPHLENFISTHSRWDLFNKPLSTLALIQLPRLVEGSAHAQTLLESTRTACAVERYRLGNKRLPVSLGDLVPAFLPAAPNDPITGRPLLYKPKEDGAFVVYGVGWNQIDDGGSVQSTPPKKPQEEADWGVSIAKETNL